ncbi:MAG: DMT family transporter [Gemmatimonadaceae bacterium]
MTATFGDRRAPVVLTAALFGISLSGPLVRISAAHPLAIASWRLAFSLVIIGVALAITGQWRQWTRLAATELAIALGAGALLALHFWSWNTAVGLTSVAASVVLVNTQPVVVALLSAVWLHEVPTRRQWTGIAIAMVGALIVASPDFASDATAQDAHPRALLGDLLSLFGAATAAVYFVVGRRLRATLDLWAYVGLVYGACLLVLLVLVAVTRAPLLPQPPREIAIFVALALGPMLLGHTGMNWALKHAPAYVVNLTLLGEPIGATIIAAMLPGIREIPGPATFIGGAVVLAGVLRTARR